MDKAAERYLPLTESTFLILVALAEPRHGYGVMQVISEASSNAIRMGPGTLYGALTKLLDQGLIEREGEGEERRKTYVLTPLGRRVVELESARLEALAALSKRILSGNGSGR